jgi:hypothetical protein
MHAYIRFHLLSSLFICCIAQAWSKSNAEIGYNALNQATQIPKHLREELQVCSWPSVKEILYCGRYPITEDVLVFLVGGGVTAATRMTGFFATAFSKQ